MLKIRAYIMLHCFITKNICPPYSTITTAFRYHSNMTFSDLTDNDLSWHDRDKWNSVTQLLTCLFNVHNRELTSVREYSGEIRKRISDLDFFIQNNTSEVCPLCESVCCINRHGYYDYHDLIYIFATGTEQPVYKEGVKDTQPCQFFSKTGCTIERWRRPFRCNWYFCDSLLRHMENGPAKPYRDFIHIFQDIIDIKRAMLEEYFRTLSKIKSFSYFRDYSSL